MYEHEETFFEGTDLMGELKFKEALPKFNAVLKTHPKYHAARSNKGLCLAAIGNFDSALDCFDYIINDDPGFAMAYAHKAVILMDMERFEESDEVYLKLVEIDPDYPYVLENEGKILLANDQEKEAIEIFEMLIKKAPEYAESVEEIMTVYIEKKNTGKKFGNANKPTSKSGKVRKNSNNHSKKQSNVDGRGLFSKQNPICKKCYPAKAQKFSPRKTWVSKCSKCKGMVITISSNGMWYVGNTMALADYFVENKLDTLVNTLFQKLTMFGFARSNPDASHDIFTSILRDGKLELDKELYGMVGSVARMTVLAGIFGKGYALCCDFDSGRLRVCDPGERFGATLYENAGTNASPDEVGDACTQFKIGMGA